MTKTISPTVVLLFVFLMITTSRLDTILAYVIDNNQILFDDDFPKVETATNYPQFSSDYDRNYFTPFLVDEITKWNKNGQVKQDLMSQSWINPEEKKNNDFFSKLIPSTSDDYLPSDDFILDDIDELINQNYFKYYPLQPVSIKFTEITGMEPIKETPNDLTITTTSTMIPKTLSNLNRTVTVKAVENGTTTLSVPKYNSTITNSTNSTNLLNRSNKNESWSLSSTTLSKLPAKKFAKSDSFSSGSDELLKDLHKNLNDFRSKIGGSTNKYDHSFGDDLDLSFGKSTSERLIHKRVPASERSGVLASAGNGR